MKITLTALERKILSAIQYGMPLSRTPYRDFSQAIGIPLEQLLTTLRQWKAQGKIRRVGAIVSHFQMGQGIGAMVVWKVPENRIDSVGELFASFAAVSHAYQRPSTAQWPYNLYTMVHACDERELSETIEAMSRKSGILEFRALKTVRELKKVPPTYIVEY
jgi:DNA-binding Lrp family transcriptional regulator